MKYRVDVFSDNKTKETYFNDLIDAVLFGQEQLTKVSVYGVFLLKENAIGKYDVTCAIK